MILVTGATGQVGSAAMNALVEADAKRIARLCESHPSFPRRKVSRLCEAASTTTGRSLRRLRALTPCCWPAEMVRTQFPRFSACSRTPVMPGCGTSSRCPLSARPPRLPIALMREHHEIDEEIRKGPADWTLLKPHLYMRICCASQMRFGARTASSSDGAQPFSPCRHPRRRCCRGGRSRRSRRTPGKANALTGAVAHSYNEVASARHCCRPCGRL